MTTSAVVPRPLRRFSPALTLLALSVVMSACSASTGLSDAARVWCSDFHNQRALGQAAVTLGIASSDAGSIQIGDNADDHLASSLEYWAGGGVATNQFMEPGLVSDSTIQFLYKEEVDAWAEKSAETFASACSAAFEGR